ncbi:MAG: FAD binding domain-containing protein [Spirochaetaceae bacterium]
MIREFKRAASVDEAVSLHDQGYVFLAGGTQVNNGAAATRGEAPERVVSLDGLGLGEIEVRSDGCLVGAGVTLQELSDHTGVPAALRRAAGFIPSRSVRNIATIGGNVGAGRSDSYLIPALIALEAQAETSEGTVSVEDYVTEAREALILRFRIPAVEGACRAVKESRSHLALPVVSAAVKIVPGEPGDGGPSAGDGGPSAVRRAVVAAGCVAARPIRLRTVEAGIVSGELTEREELENAVAKAVNPEADILGGVEFKRYLNSVVIADCILACLGEVSS